MKNISALRVMLISSLIFAPSAFGFSFGDLGKALDKKVQEIQPSAKKQAAPAPQQSQQTAPQQNAKPQGEPSLLDLGGALLGADPETTGRIKQGIQGLQKLQPLTFAEEQEIGGMLAVEVFNKFGGPYHDTKLERYINLIGKNMAEVSDRPDIEYHFALLNTEYPNAFATPGGYVMLSVGLVKMLQNEAQLAGVIGHEISHITRRHALEAIEDNRKLQGIGSIATAASGQKMDLLDQLITFSSQLIFENGLAPEKEYEADRDGTEFAYRLGYDPQGLLESLKILGQSHSQKESVFSKTHPSFENRYRFLASKIGRYPSNTPYPLLEQRFKSVVQIR